MKYASDFRRIARESLKGKWGIAIVAGIIASMLGAVTSSGPDFNFNFDIRDRSVVIQIDLCVFLIAEKIVRCAVFVQVDGFELCATVKRV